MYLKHGDITVVSDLNDIDTNGLKIGDHIVFLEKFSTFDGSSTRVNNLVVMDKKSNIILFDTNSSSSNVYREDDDSTTAYLEYERDSRQLYLKIGDELHSLGKDSSSYENIQFDTINFNSNLDGDEINSTIYKQIFEFDYKDIVAGKFKLEYTSNNLIHYTAVKINNTDYLVLTTDFAYRKKENKLYNYQNVYICTKDKKIYELNGYYNDIIKILKSSELISGFYLDELYDRNAAFDYDIKQYLKEMQQGETRLFDNLWLKVSELMSYTDVMRLFKPIYENSKINLKVYDYSAKNDYGYNSICFLGDFSNGHILSNSEIANNKEISNSRRIAHQIKSFNKYQTYTDKDTQFYTSQVNPKDGMLYSNGKLNYDLMKDRQVYIDEEGVIYLLGNYKEMRSVFLKIDGYYVPINQKDPDDLKKLEEMHERIEALAELLDDTKLKNITKIQ